jgi:hypothetical protein
VDQAKAHDPRVAAKMQALAGEQLKLSESLKDFEAYVADLIKWSGQTDKDRVTASLKDASDTLKQEGVAQRMVDAGVDLSQQDIGSARAAQADVEAALEGTTARLREAGDMLAGSKTGILGRAARQAKEVGSQVRELAGLPHRGGAGAERLSASAPSQGQQPGEGQPGQGQPGQGQPGQAQPGQGRPGESEESLAQRLAAEQQGAMGASPSQGRPGPGTNVPGGAGKPHDEIGDLWLKARELADTLRNEQLADQATLDYVGKRVTDPESFRQLFDKVRKAEAGKFSDVVTGIGKSLDEALKETLAAKKLHSEQGEECPHQYRSFVDAYFEALSKAATGKATE